MGNRTAVVTGGAQGLGEAIARSLHGRGHRVAIADVNGEQARRAAAAIDADGDRVFPITVDVRDRSALVAGFDAVEERWGRIEILVNNAARSSTTSFLDITASEWDDVLAVNLRGVFLGCQLAAERMAAAGWGRIINLSSLAGQQGGSVAGAHYAASKAGILVLTKMVAQQLAGNGVTVNAIAPAAIDGPVMGALPAERVEQIAARIPVGRIGKPEEVGALVAFLSSDEAAYVTGATFDINGGLGMR